MANGKNRNKILVMSILASVLVAGGAGLVIYKVASGDSEGEKTIPKVTYSAEDNKSDNKTNTTQNNTNSASSSATVETLKVTEKDQDATYNEAESEKIELTDNIGKINITKAGTYIVTGSTNNGMIIINVDKEEDVHLVLRDASITSPTSAAIYVMSADEVYITLEGENTLANGGNFVAIDSNDIDSVVYSKDDLSFNGDGKVTIDSPAGHGIVCKDDLVMAGGTFTISAKDDGINTNESVAFVKGVYTVDCQDDAIHTDGMLQIDGGTFNINAAEGLEGTYVLVNDGDITISASDDGINAGQKSDAYYPTIEINGGNLKITMAQGDTDGLDSNGNLYINGGTVDVTGQFPFDYDGEGKYTGGTLIVNGEETTELTNQFGGAGGFGRGGRPDMQGQDGQNGFTPPDGMTLPDGMTFPDGEGNGFTPPEGFNPQDGNGKGFTPPDGMQLPDGMTPPEGFTPPDGWDGQQGSKGQKGQRGQKGQDTQQTNTTQQNATDKV